MVCGGGDATNTEALLSSTEQDDAFCSLGKFPYMLLTVQLTRDKNNTKKEQVTEKNNNKKSTSGTNFPIHSPQSTLRFVVCSKLKSSVLTLHKPPPPKKELRRGGWVSSRKALPGKELPLRAHRKVGSGVVTATTDRLRRTSADAICYVARSLWLRQQSHESSLVGSMSAGSKDRCIYATSPQSWLVGGQQLNKRTAEVV